MIAQAGIFSYQMLLVTPMSEATCTQRFVRTCEQINFPQFLLSLSWIFFYSFVLIFKFDHSCLHFLSSYLITFFSFLLLHFISYFSSTLFQFIYFFYDSSNRYRTDAMEIIWRAGEADKME